MYVGIDLHKVYLNAAVLDDEGNVLRETKVMCEPDKVREFSSSISIGSKVVIESSSTWYWAYRMLSERHEVILSNPLKTKAIASAKVKTDKVDALTLANLLRGGYIPECYVPPKETMELRELVRYRARLVRTRTLMKNGIHAYLLMYNVKIGSNPFTKDFIRRLRDIGDPKVDGYLNVIETLNDEIDKASRTIEVQAGDNDYAKLLMTIPGISYYTALLLTSEIGDINRFPDSYHLVSYAGLSPSTHSSGGNTYHGGITKQGSPYLRWALNQVTWAHIRNEPDGTVAEFYHKLAKKKGSAIAIVAASAKLLKIIYWVLKENRPYVRRNYG